MKESCDRLQMRTKKALQSCLYYPQKKSFFVCSAKRKLCGQRRIVITSLKIGLSIRLE